MAGEIAIDVRGLEPCEPMERILTRLDTLGADQQLRALIDREPLPLYPLLEQRGFGWKVLAMDDDGCELLIWPRPQGRSGGT